jgi:methyltransferase (TIGR00027 family)
MNDGGASRTALSAALMRAVHTRLDQPLLIDDVWGDRLVSAAEQTALYERALAAVPAETRERLLRLGSRQAVIDAVLHAHPTYGGVIIRSRCAEDALADAVGRGVRQPEFARGIDIFEVDHPASQAMKRQRLAECGMTLPSNVHFVAADLGAESLATALGRSAFSATTPAFFSWLGVTIYLTRDANQATLRGVATCAAPGSEILFTYTDERALVPGRSAVLDAMRARRAAEGEAWISGFDPTTLADELRGLGLTLVEDLGGRELAARYCDGRSDNLSPGVFSHIARARVG